MGTPKFTNRRALAARRGFTFVEILTAVTMLAVLLGLMGQIMAQSKRQVVASERSAQTLSCLENTMELATSLPWDEIDEQLLDALPVVDALKVQWPESELTCEVAESSDPVPSKQITLTFKNEANATRPATLTTWVYRASSPEEP